MSTCPSGFSVWFSPSCSCRAPAPAARWSSTQSARFLLGAGLAGATAYLSIGQEIGWLSPIPVGAVAVLSLIAFILWERRHAHPVVDMTLFRRRVFTSATVSLVLSFLALFAVGFMMPFYLEQLLGSLDVRDDRIVGQLGGCRYDLRDPDAAGSRYQGTRVCSHLSAWSRWPVSHRAEAAELSLTPAIAALPAKDRAALLAILLGP